jgi:hypothetical protein
MPAKRSGDAIVPRGNTWPLPVSQRTRRALATIGPHGTRNKRKCSDDNSVGDHTMSSGPAKNPTFKAYSGPAGGWGSAKSVTEITLRERVFEGPSLLAHQNKPEGYMCVSCAWAKPAKPHPLEFCENGAKATAWEVTAKRADRAFFAAHTLSELETWRDTIWRKRGVSRIP